VGNVATIIVTGGGAPGIAGTIYALSNNPDSMQFKIITTDIYDDVVGKYLADSFYRICPPEDRDYIPMLQSIVLKEGARVVLPQTTRELSVLSENIQKFERMDCAIAVSAPEKLRQANDKFLLLEKAKSIGVPCPVYHITESEASLVDALKSLGYPKKKVVIKPRTSNGMRGLRILSEELWDVEKFLFEKPLGIEINLDALLNILRRGNWPELLVTEYLPGNEFTTDVFRGEYATVVVPRLRERMRSGITFDARIDARADLIEYSRMLADSLDLRYCFGFQFKLSDEGVPKLLESNPRVQGSMVASIFTGFNLIYCAVMEALGKPLKVKDVKLKVGLRFKRYWGGIAIDEDGFIAKI
jgi:carbamoyl-phosphate synthase large subunit